MPSTLTDPFEPILIMPTSLLSAKYSEAVSFLLPVRESSLLMGTAEPIMERSTSV